MVEASCIRSWRASNRHHGDFGSSASSFFYTFLGLSFFRFRVFIYLLEGI